MRHADYIAAVTVPDTKDWTWVLDRRCPECGFEASAGPKESLAELVRANGRGWHALLIDGVIVSGRPDPATWSPLEYACHVRDVYRRFDQRIALMVTDDDPLFPNWDQDASAIDERYEEQDPAVAVAELGENAEAIARRIGALAETDWRRPGRRSDGASFTVEALIRYMVHDPVHHMWDVTGCAD